MAPDGDDGNDNDPYAVLIPHCECPAEQKLLLRDLPFYDPFSDVGDGDSPATSSAAVASTPIVMVSPPETSSASSEDNAVGDVFTTPPEENLPVSASSVEPMPLPRDGAAADDGDHDNHGFRDVEVVPSDWNRVVDLGKDSDPGFLNEPMASGFELKRGVRVLEMDPNLGREGGSRRKVARRSKPAANQEISLEGHFTRSKSKGSAPVSGGEPLSRGSKSKVLEEISGETPFKKSKLTVCEESSGAKSLKKSKSKSEAEVFDEISGENPSEKSKLTIYGGISDEESPKVRLGSSGDGSLKESRVCGEDAGLSTPTITSEQKIKSIEANNKNISGKTVNASGCSSNGANEVVDINSSSEDAVRADSEVKETPEGMEDVGFKSEVKYSATKNPDDIEKFKYVCSNSQRTSILNRPRRELPLSMHQHPSSYGSTESRRVGLETVQDVLKLLSVSKSIDDDLEHANLFEVAVRCGMTFPQPRWWRPGGYR